MTSYVYIIKDWTEYTTSNVCNKKTLGNIYDFQCLGHRTVESSYEFYCLQD